MFPMPYLPEYHALAIRNEHFSSGVSTFLDVSSIVQTTGL